MLIVSRWLWRERTLAARAARLALVPLSFAYRGAVAVRVAAYRTGMLRRRRPALPAVAVGNLTVGGSGKTPIAQWMAAWFADRGRVPAIVLRGYGGDEGDEHRARVPVAIVLEDPDRLDAIQRAARQGAQVAILDDAFQRLSVLPMLTVAVVSAESSRAVGWLLPAGPWREPWRALRRADLVIVTRKRAHAGASAALAGAVRELMPGTPVARARLSLAELRGLVSNRRMPIGQLAGTHVLAVAGIADPDGFAEELRRLGANVRLDARADHAPYGERDVAFLLQAGRSVDYVVVTAKDAVKLHRHWPTGVPEPLVAQLELSWEEGGTVVVDALETIARTAQVPHVRYHERG